VILGEHASTNQHDRTADRQLAIEEARLLAAAAAQTPA